MQLFCTTEPVVELSPRTVIGCLEVGWPQLSAQIAKAGMDPWNCRWSEVFNFTPDSPWTAKPLPDNDAAASKARASNLARIFQLPSDLEPGASLAASAELPYITDAAPALEKGSALPELPLLTAPESQPPPTVSPFRMAVVPLRPPRKVTAGAVDPSGGSSNYSPEGATVQFSITTASGGDLSGPVFAPKPSEGATVRGNGGGGGVCDIISGGGSGHTPVFAGAAEGVDVDSAPFTLAVAPSVGLQRRSANLSSR